MKHVKIILFELSLTIQFLKVFFIQTSTTQSSIFVVLWCRFAGRQEEHNLLFLVFSFFSSSVYGFLWIFQTFQWFICQNIEVTTQECRITLEAQKITENFINWNLKNAGMAVKLEEIINRDVVNTYNGDKRGETEGLEQLELMRSLETSELNGKGNRCVRAEQDWERGFNDKGNKHNTQKRNKPDNKHTHKKQKLCYL